MVNIAIQPILGTNNARYYPHSGYLGLSPVKVQGSKHFIPSIFGTLTTLNSRPHHSRRLGQTPSSHSTRYLHPLLRGSHREGWHFSLPPPPRTLSNTVVKER